MKRALSILIALLLCVSVFVGCDKNNELQDIHSSKYDVKEVTYQNGMYSFTIIAGENSPIYAISEDMQLSSQKEYGELDEWTNLGKLEKIDLTKDIFDDLFHDDGWVDGQSANRIRKDNANAWQLLYNQEHLYYVLQQKNGDLYLAYGYYDYSEKDDTYSDDTLIRWLFKLAVAQNGSILTEFDMYCTVSEISSVNPKTIKLSKTDNTCQFGHGIESSAVGIGTYELTDTTLTLTLEQDHVYFFNVVGEDLVFDADKSSSPVVEDGTVFKKIKQSTTLNMATLISLVETYGNDVTWDTFAPFYCEEIGSGLYILRYPIENMDYSLMIGGSSPVSSPMYVRLVSDNGGGYIDIRTDSIEDFISSNNVDHDFEPGVILLGLKEQYEGDICELFPELSIAEVEDTNLKRYERIKDLPDMEQLIEKARSKIGTEFIITLTDNTKDAVLSGVSLIEENPIVDYVTPNYVEEPSCKGDN